MSLNSVHTNFWRGTYQKDLLLLLKAAENDPLRYLAEGRTGGSDAGLRAQQDRAGSIAIGYGYDLIQNAGSAIADLQAVGATVTNAASTQTLLNRLLVDWNRRPRVLASAADLQTLRNSIHSQMSRLPRDCF